MMKGSYRSDSLDREGFIHCSLPRQLVTVANRFYAGQAGLVLLCMEGDRLTAEVRYEAVDGDEFPHLYGSLNLEAVTQVLDFEPNAEGLFDLPPELQQAP